MLFRRIAVLATAALCVAAGASIPAEAQNFLTPPTLTCPAGTIAITGGPDKSIPSQLLFGTGSVVETGAVMAAGPLTIVSYLSWDGYVGRTTTPAQLQEQWVVEVGGVRSAPTADLADGVEAATRSGSLGTINTPGGPLRFVHASTDNSVQSVVPIGVCVIGPLAVPNTCGPNEITVVGPPLGLSAYGRESYKTSVYVPAGTVTASYVSYDTAPGRVSENELNEQWFIRIGNGRSALTRELPEGALAVQWTLAFPSFTTNGGYVEFLHAELSGDVPEAEFSANSISTVRVCLAAQAIEVGAVASAGPAVGVLALGALALFSVGFTRKRRVAR